jgi:hypothetical protein
MNASPLQVTRAERTIKGINEKEFIFCAFFLAALNCFGALVYRVTSPLGVFSFFLELREDSSFFFAGRHTTENYVIILTRGRYLQQGKNLLLKDSVLGIETYLSNTKKGMRVKRGYKFLLNKDLQLEGETGDLDIPPASSFMALSNIFSQCKNLRRAITDSLLIVDGQYVITYHGPKSNIQFVLSFYGDKRFRYSFKTQTILEGCWYIRDCIELYDETLKSTFYVGIDSNNDIRPMRLPLFYNGDQFTKSR